LGSIFNFVNVNQVGGFSGAVCRPVCSY